MASVVYWETEPERQWMPGYQRWVDKRLPDIIAGIFDARADEITEWMRANAVWKDRTGNARRSLHAEVIREDMIISLVMSYTIPIFYSRYLETMRNGHFSILSPALDYWSPVLLNDLRSALRG